MIHDLSWQSLAPQLIIDGSALPLTAGSQLSLTLSASRHCIGYRTFKETAPKPCPSNTELPPGKEAQCDFCRKNDMSFTAKTGYGLSQQAADLLNTKHALYLAYFANNLVKVGVALWDRREVRVSEQGAVACMFVAQGNGTAMRNLERQIHTRIGLPEWVRQDTKLAKLCEREPTEAIALTYLQNAYEKVISKTPSTALLDKPDSHYLLPRYQMQPDIYSSPIEIARLIRGDARIAGSIVGIYGKILLLNIHGTVLAINTRLLVGYDAIVKQNEEAFALGIDRQILIINRQLGLFG